MFKLCNREWIRSVFNDFYLPLLSSQLRTSTVSVALVDTVVTVYPGFLLKQLGIFWAAWSKRVSSLVYM